MSNSDLDEQTKRLDAATAKRLSRLRTIPVDTSALEKRLAFQIPQPRRSHSRRERWFPVRLEPLGAAAAILLALSLGAALLLSTSSGPALASAEEMARLHYHLVSGKAPVLRVDSIEAANNALGPDWPQSPALPKAPAVMACCMQSVRNKKVATILLRDERVPVTMMVASAADMKLPAAPTVERAGVTYHAQSSGNLNMVMTARHGRWVCLIAELPVERLIEVAAGLKF